MGATDLAKDALHVHIGLLIFFATAAVFRWPLRSWRPWAAVLVVTLGGEAWDIADNIVGNYPVFPGENLHDVWNTMLWPTLIMLMARFTPILPRR